MQGKGASAKHPPGPAEAFDLRRRCLKRIGKNGKCLSFKLGVVTCEMCTLEDGHR